MTETNKEFYEKMEKKFREQLNKYGLRKFIEDEYGHSVAGKCMLEFIDNNTCDNCKGSSTDKNIEKNDKSE
jgi:hypothetical protein